MYKRTHSKCGGFLGFKVFDCFPKFFLFREPLSVPLRCFLILVLMLVEIKLTAARGSKQVTSDRAFDTLRHSPHMRYSAIFVVVGI